MRSCVLVNKCQAPFLWRVLAAAFQVSIQAARTVCQFKMPAADVTGVGVGVVGGAWRAQAGMLMRSSIMPLSGCSLYSCYGAGALPCGCSEYLITDRCGCESAAGVVCAYCRLHEPPLRMYPEFVEAQGCSTTKCTWHVSTRRLANFMHCQGLPCSTCQASKNCNIM